jgi:hypothetical protein
MNFRKINVTLMNLIIPSQRIWFNKWFPKKVMNEVTNLKVNDTAIRRVAVEWITIDWLDAKDLDDWIYAEKRLDWWYTLQISIADVSQIVKPWTEIDKEAFDRTTSIYLRTHVCPMIPSEIWTDICSLNDQTTKLTFTIQIDTDSEFNVKNTEIFKSTFKNRKRFDYEEFYKQFNNCWEEYNDELNLYNVIARSLLSKRVWRWAIKWFKDKIVIKLYNWEENKVHTAQLVVQEFMILANIEIAKLFYREEIDWIFKLHNPKLKWQIIWPEANLNTAFFYNQPWFHLWLWQQFYTNFTSPIRRYVDLIIHRQLDSWLNKEKPIYDLEELRACYIYMNWKRDKIINYANTHYKDIKEKRKERKYKKTQNSVQEKILLDINSLSIYDFTELINFIKKWEIELNEEIKKEILFRLDNNLLSQENMYNIIFFTKDKKIITNIISKIKYNHSYNDFLRFCNTYLPDTKIDTSFNELNWIFYWKWDIKINWDHIEINYSIDLNKTNSDKIKKNARKSVTNYIRSKAKEFILEKILSKLK